MLFSISVNISGSAQSSTDKFTGRYRGACRQLLTSLFSHLLDAARLAVTRSEGQLTLEIISALLGISELQFVIDCLTEATFEAVSAGWNWNRLEPKPGAECL